MKPNILAITIAFSSICVACLIAYLDVRKAKGECYRYAELNKFEVSYQRSRSCYVKVDSEWVEYRAYQKRTKGH